MGDVKGLNSKEKINENVCTETKSWDWWLTKYRKLLRHSYDTSCDYDIARHSNRVNFPHWCTFVTGYKKRLCDSLGADEKTAEKEPKPLGMKICEEQKAVSHYFGETSGHTKMNNKI